MTTTWAAADLALLGAAAELEIAVERADGTRRPWVPIWVVCADGQVYVRTWYRRGTGWFGAAVRTRRAAIRVPGLTADVGVADIGDGSAQIRDAVDDAYRRKYGAGSGSMVTPSAVATTLRLDPAQVP